MTLRNVYETVRKVIIYEIVCNITGERYIGSTIDSLNRRMTVHNSKNKRCSSKIIIQRGDYNVNELESFNTKFELAQLLKEQYWMDNTENINIQRAFTNQKKRQKKYDTENRELIKEKRSRKRKLQVPINCPCGGKYKQYNKSQHFRTKKHRRYIDTQ